MFDEKTMKVFYDVFDASLPRLAPGDDRSTRRALEVLFGPDLEEAGEAPAILDLGCGNGCQTLRLAAELGGPITAIDNHAPYLAELERRAHEAGVGERIETLCQDMNALDLGGRRFDLIWAEGSAYNVGIAEALTAWRDLLVPAGAYGFTELCWTSDDVPGDCRTYFEELYPAIADVRTTRSRIVECGYDEVGHFALPSSSWWDPYYRPLGERLDGFEKTRGGDETVARVLEMVRREIAVFHEYSDSYGYVFFLARRRD